MLFKGTKKRSAAEIAEAMDAIGGQMNAFTSKEYTCYLVRTLDSYIYEAIDILTDMFFNSRFDGADIEKESKVIAEEINMYEDSPDELIHDILQSAVWDKSSLGQSVLGPKSNINNFKRDDFINYIKNNYHAGNTVISIAGNFDEDMLIGRIEELFSDYIFLNKSDDKKHTEFNPCIVTREKDIEQLHLLLSFKGIGLDSQYSYALTALNTYFGGGMSSKLFQAIREEHGLAYSVYSYPLNFVDTGLFTIYAALNKSQTEQVIGLIIQEIKKLHSTIISKDQLNKIKAQLKSNYIIGIESSISRMNYIGKSMLMLDKIIEQDTALENIETISPDDISGLINTIFDLDRLSLAAVGNVSNLNFKDMIINAR
jgi:predicted Zn-dependent peptidase